MKKDKKARVIAFYLPQFHQIKENDEWWGTGFTEWTNVGNAKPLFKGHNQPRVPTTLGYYDLMNPKSRIKQAELAKESGIEGFLYWHYWFGKGKRILEKPFNEVLKSGEPDLPFCLGWANHSWNDTSWSSNAKKSGNKYLLEQTYPGKEDYVLHFNTMLPAFKDPRYIKVNNKPLFVVYDPVAIPSGKQLIDVWQKLAKDNGLEGIHFVGRDNSGIEHQNILNMGFDAVNTNGQWSAESKIKGKYLRILRSKIRDKTPGLLLDSYNYKDIINCFYTENDRKSNFYPMVIPQWDRSPRAGKKAVIYKGSSPQLFKQHLNEAIDIVSAKPDEEQIIFLKSWNEWGEGNYVEPDLLNGHKYIDTLKDSLYKGG
jgi:hypothetical protein